LYHQKFFPYYFPNFKEKLLLTSVFVWRKSGFYRFTSEKSASLKRGLHFDALGHQAQGQDPQSA